ncbi:MAG: hypothetical protein ACOCUS_02020 [Polyangiales bacterium]
MTDPTPARPDSSSGPSLAEPRWWWLGLLALAAVEVVGHFVIQSRVPPMDDWRDAAALVRIEHGETDAVSVAPSWADPLMRQVAGDVVSLRQAGRSDLAPWDRLWVLSIRGHRSPEAPDVEPDLERRFGRVTVRRYPLGPSPALYDFVEHVREARVTRATPKGEEPCPWQRRSPRGGGLGEGAMWPSDRFVCDPRRAWLWVGRTVVEDLEYQPRTCIRQHPQGRRPIRTTFRDVPLGERIVLYAGLYNRHERDRDGRRPVYVRVLVDGIEVGRMEHRDGDGWKRMEALSTADSSLSGRERGDVTIEVTAPKPHHRSLCWSATTRGESPREGSR